jgi:muramoyltetrapeptide carboxypeptidase
VLESWGLRVRDSLERPEGVHRYLADTDDARAVELTAALTDPDVRAVWATRGGYGTQRLLDRLDWPLLARARPRLLVGFSDVTALHQAVAARLGAVTVHAAGVAGLGDADPATVAATRLLVMEGAPASLSGTPAALGPAAAGSAEGILVGGNITVLASSLGSALVHPASGGIAVLEDVGERPYRLDRALTQLLRAGWFDEVRGVACGTFSGCGDPAEVRAVLEDRLGGLGVPVVLDLPFGHTPTNLPLALGVRAVIDGSAGTLTVGRCLV